MENFNLSDDAINNMNIICAATGRQLTEEQMMFASDFTKPTISFSDAGTGKTYTVAVGLVHAQTYHKIPGSKICVLSFTREAAREISERYDIMSQFKFLSSKARFSTFHALCMSIITDAWGRPNIKDFSYGDDLADLRSYAAKEGLEDVSDMWLKRLYQAINSLNASFIFDPNEMELTYKFKQLKISPTTFNRIRRSWFLRQKALKTIPRGDLPLHCFDLLKRNEMIARKYGKMFDLLVIDEFQDMSNLYVKIVKELCNVPVVIGDMKQQIYAFNGASDEIVDEFLSSYPDARICPLTQSFRNKDEIVEFATNLIKPNEPALYGFKGVGKGGTVDIIRNRELPIADIAKEIYNYQQNLETTQMKDIMFLFRNNFSGMSVMEMFYREGVRFRCSKFKKVMDLPIFRELCKLLDAAEDPYNVDKVWDALCLFDEFKYSRKDNCGVIMVMQKYGKSWLDMNYQYKEPAMHDVIKILRICAEGIKAKKSAGQLFKTLLPVYENLIIKGKWYMLEFSKEFYFNLVAPIANDKTYPEMRSQEYDKENKNDEAMAHFDGVRCYTIHSAKGLEADAVYIIDCEEGVIPSSKNLNGYVKEKCLYEAARMLRNERNLLYVAATRARDEVHICYTTELAHLISQPEHNEYSYLDEVYKSTPREFYNLDYFMDLYRYKNTGSEN